jgi:hypothetical protein
MLFAETGEGLPFLSFDGKEEVVGSTPIVCHFQPLTVSFFPSYAGNVWSANQCGWRFSRKASTPSTASGTFTPLPFLV